MSIQTKEIILGSTPKAFKITVKHPLNPYFNTVNVCQIIECFTRSIWKKQRAVNFYTCTFKAHFQKEYELFESCSFLKYWYQYKSKCQHFFVKRNEKSKYQN